MLRNPHVGQRVVVRYAKNKGQLPLHGACGTARNGPHAALAVLVLVVLAVVLVHVLAHLLLFCCHHGHRRIMVVPTHFEESTDGST
ncbi:MAG: hypothetical protein JO252_23160 [Planctomycetaceae bacterium]|nr:hypothetical protein [Planctomycetaceae bacterium]